MQIVMDITRQRAALTPDKPAIIELNSGIERTYRDLDDRANRFAAALGGMGIGRGDRIAILCHNVSAFFEILFACGKAGVILVPLNWRLAVPELIPILGDCGPKLVLHDAANAGSAVALAEATGVTLMPLAPGGGPGGGDYESTVANAPGEPVGDGTHRPDDVWYLLYTSGTTGKPKAVMQTFGMAYANYVNIGQGIDLTRHDLTLNFLPLFHTAGINLHTVPTLIAGGTVRLMATFDPDATMRAIKDGLVTAFFGVPAIYQALSLHPDFASTDLSHVRSWGCGGAPLPEPLQRAFLDRGARVCCGFGMTETGPTVLLMDAASVEGKIGSSGRPQILAQVRIVDADGEDMARGQSGELIVRGPVITPGYWNNEEATRAAFEPGGWLHTGDVAMQDEDGYYFIVDRIKDMFISGGENVYPAEVEQVLHAHVDVLEAAVVGIPDEKWGEVGRAFILPRPGHEPDPQALIDHCRANLAGYKVPKSIVIVEDFPRTAAGKVRKHILRQQSEATA